MRNFHFPGRSAVYAKQAMCATSHPLASQSAIDILKQGGNAVDAALAASAVLAVVEPHMTGIGGDCFALLHKPGHALIGLSGVGRAPQAASVDWHVDNNMTEIMQTSPHAVTIPGAIDAWCRLSTDHGRLPLSRVFKDAIDYARNGFPVAPRIAWDWKRFSKKLSVHQKTKAAYLPNGKPPDVGDILMFPELADTLQAIAERGRDAFYAGPIAQDMVETLKSLGGQHVLGDFLVQKSDYVSPIKAAYGELDIYELPPSNQGITALMMFQMLSRLQDRGSEPVCAKRYHVMMEVARLAYSARNHFLSDPDAMEVSHEYLISDELADQLAARIDPEQRVPDLGAIPTPNKSDTVYLAVVDKDGMAISFINSLYSAFGSAITAPKSGVLLHCRGYGFRFTPGHANSIGSRKRPMHTLLPAMAFKNRKPALVFGVMGADFQPTGHIQVITNILDYGLDPQQALDSPRVFFKDNVLSVEEGIPASVVTELEAMGHQVERCVEEPWGGGQLIAIDDKTGALIGASDPRKDGIALGY
ncbi:MAG: gamma-glutamyltransferase [Pseudomonadota bacterium]